MLPHTVNHISIYVFFLRNFFFKRTTLIVFYLHYFQTTYGCRSSSFVGLRSTPHHPEHQLRMRRPPKLRCQLGLAKHSHACSAIKWACERLGVEVLPPPSSLTSEAILNSWTTANREGHPPHVIILDCRANKRLDVESVARYAPI